MSGCRSSVEVLGGKDEFHGSKTHPSSEEKIVTPFRGLELEYLGLGG